MSFFGLLIYKLKSLSPKEQYSKGYIKHKSIKLTPLGSNFFNILDRKRTVTLWNMPFRYSTGAEYSGQDYEDEHSIPEAFIEPFRQVLTTGTAIEKGLTILKPDNLRSTFIFKVSIAGTWKTISISRKNTLDDLHLAIQKTYSFGNDHLYSFSFDPLRLHLRKSYHSPEGSEYPYAS